MIQDAPNPNKDKVIKDIEKSKEDFVKKVEEYLSGKLEQGLETQMKNFMILKIDLSKVSREMEGHIPAPHFDEAKEGEMFEYLAQFTQELVGNLSTNGLEERDKEIINFAIKNRMLNILIQLDCISRKDRDLLIPSLRKCKSFEKWLAYGNGNIDEARNKFCLELFESLPFDNETNLNVFKKLVEEPLENIISECKGE